MYDFFFDKTKSKWVPWVDELPTTEIDPEADYTKIIVNTADTMRYSFLVKTLASNNRRLLLVGPTGTGKTVYIKQYLLSLDSDKFSYLMFNFSAQTSANMTQDILDIKLDKRKKGVYGPPVGKKMMIFMDDLNMPQVIIRIILNI